MFAKLKTVLSNFELFQKPLITQKNRWEFFDLSSLGIEVSGYAETLFDGRYY